MRLLLTILLISISLYSNELRKNYEIIDSLANKTNTEIINKIKNRNIKAFIPKFNDCPAYFKTIFISKLYEMDINLSGDSLDINILKYKPRYTILGDSIIRNFEYFISSNNLQIKERSFYSEKLPIDELSFIEDSEFQFDKAILPKGKSSFWDKYLEPIIIIGSSLITVLLLFTVRSS